MSRALRKKPYTREDFLAWEEAQEERWEFVDGVITMMAGGTLDHNTIASNITVALDRALGAKNCRVLQHNQKVTPAENEDSTYPDVVVVCGARDGKATYVGGATFIAEVVSESSGRTELREEVGIVPDHPRAAALSGRRTEQRDGHRLEPAFGGRSLEGDAGGRTCGHSFARCARRDACGEGYLSKNRGRRSLKPRAAPPWYDGAMPRAAVKKPYTRADFLSWEEAQERRWEFVDGVMTMMAGGTVDHNTIADNVAAALRSAARAKGCRTFTHNQKVTPARNEDSTYPDVLVVCGKLAGSATAVEAAAVIVEAVSKSSRTTDYGKKWDSYRSIDELRHYVAVQQDEAAVLMFSRTSEAAPWRKDESEGLDAQVMIAALGVTLTLRQIYERTSLAP